MELAAATVAVRWSVLGPAIPPAVEADLTPSELARADRFLVEDARHRYLVGRSCLRRTLGGLLGTTPRDVPLTASAAGKPELELSSGRAELAFNLSHSGDVVVAAFARCSGLGIDVEVPDRDHDGARLARRFFTPREAAAVTAAADPTPVFLHLWTAKEAWMKAVGEGLGIAPRDVEITPDAGSPPRLVALPPGNDSAAWTLRRVALPVPATCTLALPAGDWRLDIAEWRP